MGQELDHISSEIESQEEELENAESRSEEIEQKEDILKEKCEALENDTTIQEQLAGKLQEHSKEKEEVRRNVLKIQNRIEQLQEELQDEMENLENETQTLQGLAEIGEDISAAEEILSERKAEISSMSQQLEGLSSRTAGIISGLPGADKYQTFSNLDDKTRTALEAAPDGRTARQVELADTARHAEYSPQTSFKIENGKLVEVKWGEKGSKRPDNYAVDANGRHYIREEKNYHNFGKLKANIRKQTEERRKMFGKDAEITYIVAPNFSYGQAEELRHYLEDELGVNLEWLLK